MVTRLPHGARALIDMRKLEDYCLDPAHPRGCHKARVFLEVLGLAPENATLLRDVLLAAAKNQEAVRLASTAWGRQWRLDTR